MHIQLSARVSVAQKIQITHEQVVAVRIAQLQLRRDLIEAVHGDRFTPKATCLQCHHALTDYEIMKGFNDDPRDYTTQCPKCRHRFFPRLHRSTSTGSTEMAFYCPTQTLDQLRDLVNTPLDDLQVTCRSIYNSAVVHFGGLKQAFKRLGLTYAHEADLDWKKQVKPFLGKMADTVIAELVGVHAKTVRRLRYKLGVASYSWRDEAESLSL